STGANLARVLGVLAGTVLIVLGTLGLIAAWVEVYGSTSHSGRYYFPATRLTMSFAIGGGLAIVVGAIILRDTFRKAGQVWLVPLKIFTTIGSARIVSDQVRREHGKPLLDAPQSDSDKNR